MWVGDTDVLVTKDSHGYEERTGLDYQDMIQWVGMNYKLERK